MHRFSYLNEIYGTLCEKAKLIKALLDQEGVKYTCGFYNNHYVKKDGAFVAENYPIPVFSAENIGDIGIDIDNVWLEIVLPKEKALELDYAAICGFAGFELYGASDFLTDLYNAEMPLSGICDNIAKSGEREFCLLFSFGENPDITKLRNTLCAFKN